MPRTFGPSVVDEALIEEAPAGFALVLTGDFTDAFADYLAADPASAESCTVRLVLSRDAALQIAGQVRATVGPWSDTLDAPTSSKAVYALAGVTTAARPTLMAVGAPAPSEAVGT